MDYDWYTVEQEIRDRLREARAPARMRVVIRDFEPRPRGPKVHSMREILAAFLKIGVTAYGGPAIQGVMQAEFQERRQWLTKPQFIEGLAFVNMLPGATATQLGIFLGYRRAGRWGGLLAGLGFCAPAFAIMLALTLAYSAFGVSPTLR